MGLECTISNTTHKNLVCRIDCSLHLSLMHSFSFSCTELPLLKPVLVSVSHSFISGCTDCWHDPRSLSLSYPETRVLTHPSPGGRDCNKLLLYMLVSEIFFHWWSKEKRDWTEKLHSLLPKNAMTRARGTVWIVCRASRCVLFLLGLVEVHVQTLQHWEIIQDRKSVV